MGTGELDPPVMDELDQAVLARATEVRLHVAVNAPESRVDRRRKSVRGACDQTDRTTMYWTTLGKSNMAHTVTRLLTVLQRKSHCIATRSAKRAAGGVGQWFSTTLPQILTLLQRPLLLPDSEVKAPTTPYM